MSSCNQFARSKNCNNPAHIIHTHVEPAFKPLLAFRARVPDPIDGKQRTIVIRNNHLPTQEQINDQCSDQRASEEWQENKWFVISMSILGIAVVLWASWVMNG